MKLYLKVLALFLACGLACGYAHGQTSSAKTTFTVTATPLPYVNVTISPSTGTVVQGNPISFAIAVTAPAGSTQGAVVGSIELLVTTPGAATPTVSTYTVQNGAVIANYVVNATAKVGTYSVEAAYCSTQQLTANYSTSADCQ